MRLIGPPTAIDPVRGNGYFRPVLLQRQPDPEPDHLPQQLTLSFDPRQHWTRADFQVGSANRAVINALDSWPNWPSHVLCLIGPEASGKSHLVSILASECGAQVSNAAKADWHGIAAGLADAPAHPIVIEDAGPGLHEAGLFHLINAVQSAKGSLLLTSRTLPGDWQLSLPDLSSRLRAATPVTIDEPDDALLEAILAKHFADRQTTVDPAVIRYCVPRMERTYAAARNLVARLDSTAIARKSAVTRALASDILTVAAAPGLPDLDDDPPRAKPS
jgi:chromosomal replication initiation ATPase DnaA